MRTLVRLSLVCLLTLPLLAGTTVSDARYAHLARGVNLTRWFQYGSSIPITAADRDLLQRAGFTSVRIAVAPQYLLPKWSSARRIERNLSNLDAAVDLFVNAGVAVMLDFHADTPYLNYFLATPAAPQELVDTWRMLARRYHDRDPELLFFEILNEPDRRFTQAAWDGVQLEALRAIRETAPDHTVLLAPAAWSGLEGLMGMTPYEDTNVVYVLHYYSPMTFTHQGATWSSPDLARLRNVSWPAWLPEVEAARDLESDPAARTLLDRYREEDWDATSLDWDMGLAAAWAARQDVRVIVNEFGGYKPFTPPEARARWTRDVRTAIEHRHFGWTFWDYGAGFDLTVLDAGARTIDPAISAALGLSPWNAPEPPREFPAPPFSALRTVETSPIPDSAGAPLAYVSAMAAADLNGDGLPDLVVTHAAPDHAAQPVRLYVNQGGGLLEAASFDGPAPMTQFVASIVPGKFDRSGKMGFFLPDRSATTSHLLLPSPTGLLKDVPVEMASTVLSAVAEDLNADGVDDLVVFGERGLAALRNDGEGHFRPDSKALPAWLSDAKREDNHFLCGVMMPGGLAIFGAPGTAPRLLRNDGKGRFHDGTLLPAPPANSGPAPGGCAAAGDLNGDGLADLVVAWKSAAPGEPDLLQILINGGNGNFRDETALRSGPLPPSRTGLDRIALAQTKPNGPLTLVITRIGEPPVLRLDYGNGTFVDSGWKPRGGPWLAVPADLNGDGLLDLVFGQGSSAPLAARFGQGPL